MNEIDQEKQRAYLEKFYPSLVETLVRNIGQLERDFVSVDIGELVNCVFGAAFVVISHEYARMDEKHFDDEEQIDLIKELFYHNLKQFRENLPRDRASYKEYLEKSGKGLLK